MTIVREFYMNTEENTSTPVIFVRRKHVHYDTGMINQLFCLQYTPHGLDELDLLVKSANMEEISNEICGRATKWNIVRGEHAYFPSKDLHQNMKVWHHFICGRLVPTLHTSEVTKDRALLLYGIKKRLKINVGGWIHSNIRHTIQQGSGGIPHPTLLTELIASYGIDTTGQEVLQPKYSLNPKEIEWIVTLELIQKATGASYSGA